MNFFKIDEAIVILIALFCLIFCVLALFVLIYYIRRKYFLYVEMKEISDEKLWFYSYQNHLKNLKIKSMIANFVIIIVLVEFVNSIAIFQQCTWLLINFKTIFVFIAVTTVSISRLCHVPLLCLFMKVLWLAYLHSPYKHTIMRWTAYIVLRIFVVIIALIGQKLNYFSGFKYANFIYLILNTGMYSLFIISDLIIYLVYSRRFYLHLKSRELEARLFMDRRKYLENKFLRIHFKVATILVTVALLFYSIGNLLSLVCTMINNMFLAYSNESLTTWYLVNQVVGVLPLDILQVIYRVLFNLNYLYILFIILYKRYKQKRNLNRVNDRIRPLVREYQDKYYNR